MSPIFYGNAVPHIGHLYTGVLCDAMTRVENQLLGSPTKLSIGTDEHGLKIQKKAGELGVTPMELVTKNSLVFKDLFDRADVRYDRFIRTTDEDHRVAVTHMWNRLAKSAIVSGTHEGYYSTNDETFYPEKDLIKKENDFYTQVGEKCEKVTEKNYVFKVDSEARKAVKSWI